MRHLPSLLDRGARRWLTCPKWVRALPPMTVMALLWWSSSREPAPGPHDVPGILWRNSMHVVAYAILGTSLLLALHSVPRRRVIGPGLWSFLIAVAYGIVDELHQSFVPGRVCSVADLGADAAGAALALAIVVPWLQRERPRGAILGLCLLACLVSVALATWDLF